MFRCASCGALNRVPPNKTAGEANCGKCHHALDVSGAPQNVNGDQLMRAIASSPVPVLVDVWAPWCGPCRMMAPTLDAVAKAKAGQLLVLKLNSDENPQQSAGFGIRGIPTLLLFRNGAEIARQSGALSRPMMEGFLKPHLEGGSIRV